MKISTKARYGIRALMEVALRGGKEPVLLKEIAENQKISISYLEHLVAPLIAAGIIRSTRGVRGGIRLAKEPRDIKLIDVVHIFEGTMAPVECVDKPDICNRSTTCVTRDVWLEVKQAIDGVLGSLTLQDMVDRQKNKNQRVMYYI